MKNVLIVCFLCMIQIVVYADSFDCINKKPSTGEDKAEEPLKIGNLSLKTSQQPAPLVGLGEHVIDKGEAQFLLFADASIGRSNYKTDVIPSVVYGITDRFSVSFNVPFAPKNKNGDHTSSGIEDIFLQLEYAFYSKNHKCSADQATIVGSVAFPTGSIKKNPQTGFGSTSFLLGLTYNHTAFDWFYFGSPGFLFTTKHDGQKFGNQFLYQLGIGRNICTPPGWIYAWMVEFTGLYSWKGIIGNNTNHDSGGNVIFVTPSLWISSERLIIQFGVGFPIVQHLFGVQSKQRLSLDFNFGWTF